MTYNLSAGVMAIPERAKYVLGYLLPTLRKDIPAVATWDTLKGARGNPHMWINARNAWTCYDKNATHHVHLADDVLLCPDFVAGIYKVIEAYPDQLINLFVTKRPAIQTALKQNIHWMRCWGLCWGAGSLMPVTLINEFLDWEHRHVRPLYPHDDGRLSMWAQLTNRYIWLPVPMLIEHVGGLHSTLGHNHGEKKAAAFLTTSPLEIDWGDTRFKTLSEPVPDDYIQKWVI